MYMRFPRLGGSHLTVVTRPTLQEARTPKLLVTSNGPTNLSPAARANAAARRKTAAAEKLGAVILERDLPLALGAAGVLIDNDMGFAVKPSPKLYPHQWDWDSALIA